MPIKIPDSLPARAILESENIFVMTEHRAIHQDMRPLNLLILPLQFGTPISGVWTQMGILLPFNALKALLDAACVFFLLPCLRKPLTKAFYPLYNKQ